MGDRLNPTGSARQRMLRVPTSLDNAIAAEAKDLGVSWSEAARVFLAAGLERKSVLFGRLKARTASR